MFLAGIIDKGGRFASRLETPRLRRREKEPEFVIAWAKETAIGHDIVITRKTSGRYSSPRAPCTPAPAS